MLFSRNFRLLSIFALIAAAPHAVLAATPAGDSTITSKRYVDNKIPADSTAHLLVTPQASGGNATKRAITTAGTGITGLEGASSSGATNIPTAYAVKEAIGTAVSGADISDHTVNGAPLSNTASYYYGSGVGAAGTAAKTVTISSITTAPTEGMTIVVNPAATASTETSLTLNLNSTGAKTVKYNGSTTLTAAQSKAIWKKDVPVVFVYDGTNWLYSGKEYTAGTGISISDANAITNTGVHAVTASGTSAADGTISVNTNGESANVAVKGWDNKQQKITHSSTNKVVITPTTDGGATGTRDITTVGANITNLASSSATGATNIPTAYAVKEAIGTATSGMITDVSGKQDKDNNEVYKVGYNGGWANANTAVAVDTTYLDKTNNDNGSVTVKVDTTKLASAKTDITNLTSSSTAATKGKLTTAYAVKTALDDKQAKDTTSKYMIGQNGSWVNASNAVTVDTTYLKKTNNSTNGTTQVAVDSSKLASAGTGITSLTDSSADADKGKLTTAYAVKEAIGTATSGMITDVSGKQDKDNNEVYKVGYNGGWANANTAVAVDTTYLDKTNNDNGSVTVKVDTTKLASAKTDITNLTSSSTAATKGKLTTAYAVKQSLDDKQNKLPYDATANLIIAPTTDGGEATKRAIATAGTDITDLTSSSTDTNKIKIPTAYAVKQGLDGKQQKITHSSTNKVVITPTTDGGATGTRDITTAGTGITGLETSSSSGATNIPTAYAVKEAISGAVSGADISGHTVNGAPLSNEASYYYGSGVGGASSTEKTVQINSITSLQAGQIIAVKPTVTSTVAGSTIKLNDFAAYPMRYNGAAITTSTDSIVWNQNYVSIFVFDGTYWQFAGGGIDNNTTYSALSVADGTAGTATSSRTVRADYLKQIIQGTTLTGINTTTPGAVAATDTVTTGIGKLQATKQDKLTAGTNITIDANNTISATDTTYDVFTTSANGLVPASGSNTGKFLKGDGTWATPTNTTYDTMVQTDIDNSTTTGKLTTGSLLNANYQKKATANYKVSKSDGTWNDLGTTLDTTATGYVADNAVTAGTIATALSNKQDKDNNSVYKVGYNGGWANANTAVSVDTTYLKKTDKTNGSVEVKIDTDKLASTGASIVNLTGSSTSTDKGKLPTAFAVGEAIRGIAEPLVSNIDVRGHLMNGAPLGNESSFFYGESRSGASDDTKVVRIESIDHHELLPGQMIIVKPLETSYSLRSLYLQLNDFHPYPVNYEGQDLSGHAEDLTQKLWVAGKPVIFIFDGTYWNWLGNIDTTYDVFTTGTNGLVPASGSATGKFLRGDGTWAVPTNTTYTSLTQAKIDAGTETTGRLVSAKLLRDNFYTETETDDLLNDKQDKLTAGTNITIDANNTISATDTTYDVFTTSANGLVPASGSNTGKFLKGDGTWGTPTDTNTTYSAGTGLSLSGTTFSNAGVRSVTESASTAADGTISVNTNGESANVAVKGWDNKQTKPSSVSNGKVLTYTGTNANSNVTAKYIQVPVATGDPNDGGTLNSTNPLASIWVE